MNDMRKLAMDSVAGLHGSHANQDLGHFVAGRPLEGAGQAFEILDPSTGAAIGKGRDATESELEAAVCAARDSFSEWSGTAPETRRKILNKVADLIVARADEIAAVECLDSGQCWRFMSKAALRGAENFRFFADRAPGAADGLALPSADHINITTRKAIGPVAVITPWNTPFMLSTWKIAPALAAGCTVVQKPAEWSPYSARLLVEIANEAGLPAGVFNSVNGLGETTGKRLTEHPDIKAIAFVGESCVRARRR
jgi:5-carboxymethyl-2-hydroxymuconic-semialdehyde dehydrogenase